MSEFDVGAWWVRSYGIYAEWAKILLVLVLLAIGAFLFAGLRPGKIYRPEHVALRDIWMKIAMGTASFSVALLIGLYKIPQG